MDVQRSSRPAVLPLPRLRPDQSRIALHPARVKCLAMGRRWGKTILGGTLSLSTAAAGGKVAWVVPSYKNGRPVWRWAKDAVGSLVASGAVRMSQADRTIEFPGCGGLIGIYSADDGGDSIRGDWFNLVVVDEAAMIQEGVWTEAIQPTLADAGGDAILISTPRGRNWFWREWLTGQDEMNWTHQKSWTAPTRDNPNLRIQQAAEKARTRVPDAVYRQEWEAEFLEESGLVFRQVRAAATVESGIRPYPGLFVMGVDWGRAVDYTVLTVLDVTRREVVEIDRFNQVGWELQRGRLTTLAAKWGVSAILAEANSIGEPNIHRLQAEGWPVQGFTATNATKAQLIEGLALAIETGAIRYPANLVLIGELQAFSATRTATGLIRYAAPEGLHDDMVISLALALLAGSQAPVQAPRSGPPRPVLPGNPFAGRNYALRR